MYLAVIALAPAVGLVWLLHARNPSRPLPRGLILALFVLGCGSAGLALLLNHLVEKYTALWSDATELRLRLLFWLLGIGLNEEFSKLLVLLALVYPRRSFSTPYQGLFAAATVALGFAAVENLVYLERFGTHTLLVRSLLTVPAHACFTIPDGVCLYYSKRSRTLGPKYLWLIAGLGTAVLLHGVYNIWLSLDEPWLNRLAYVQVAVMILAAMGLTRLNPPAVPARLPEAP